MSSDEELFREAVTCLQNAGIDFWVDYGTLLGIVRDNRLIPWDTDFDFSVWDHQVTEEILIKLFDSEKFRIESSFPLGIRGVLMFPHDKSTRRFIDIVIYQRAGERAIYHTFAASGVMGRLIESIERFLNPDIKAEQLYKYYLEQLFHDNLLPLVPKVIKRASNQLFQLLVEHKNRCRREFIYDYPAHYFDNLRQISFLGVNIKIPADTANYLAVAYGKDWRTPKRFHHWSEAATFIDGKRNL